MRLIVVSPIHFDSEFLFIYYFLFYEYLAIWSCSCIYILVNILLKIWPQNGSQNSAVLCLVPQKMMSTEQHMMICDLFLLAVGTNVTVGDPPVVTTVAQGERINLNLRCPENGTTLQLCVQNGTSILYASDDIENPGEAFFDYRLIVGNGSCDSVFALCRDFCSSQNPNSNPDDVGDLDNTIHITIQGSDEDNTVSIQTTDGDTTTPTGELHIATVFRW